jgi:asparaginyl-tRNA synthetase
MANQAKTYTVAELFAKAPINQKVKVKGWVRTRRDSKAGLSFIALYDGSSFAPVQVVAQNTLDNYADEILRLTAGCSIEVTGKLVESLGKGQSVEIQADTIKVLGWVDDPDTYPISPKRHTLEYLREHAHLRSRTNVIGAVARVRDSLSFAIHQFFHKNGFYWLPTPIITASDCEGAGELFRVSTLDLANLPCTKGNKIDFAEDFFGRETFLSVSGQLQAEAYACALSKVYTFGPTFRAENSNTSRHLAEFWMIEPEMAFADIIDSAKLAEDMLKFVCQKALDERKEDMEFFAKWIDKDCINRLEKVIASHFTHMDYTDAITKLQQAKQKFEFPVKWGADLQSEHEHCLSEKIVVGPVVLMNYPKDIKGFYMRQNDDGKTVAAMDVLVPGMGEIIGGSQREERFDALNRRVDELKLDKEEYQWYLDLRRYGTVKHSGFGLGFERLMCYVTGMTNVRDVIPFPRTPGHAYF